jgi:hypothetical protein
MLKVTDCAKTRIRATFPELPILFLDFQGLENQVTNVSCRTLSFFLRLEAKLWIWNSFPILCVGNNVEGQAVALSVIYLSLFHVPTLITSEFTRFWCGTMKFYLSARLSRFCGWNISKKANRTITDYWNYMVTKDFSFPLRTATSQPTSLILLYKESVSYVTSMCMCASLTYFIDFHDSH